jgi:hypothetical protein
MLKKLIALLFAYTLILILSTPVFAQEGTPAQKKAEKADTGKPAQQARWEGIVLRSSKDNSTLTVRKTGSTLDKIIHYDSSTKWVSQQHGSKKVNDIDPSQVKDGDRVIALGNEEQGEFHATLISKRLTPAKY